GDTPGRETRDAPAAERGRPPVAAPRKMVWLRLEPDVLAALRATGRGWQTRVNDLLRAAVLKKR
ncbi:MAG TPA: BrnA antitoxin family protein, partial [Acidimicrobiia bacterium]|nr:BrnA antitoxin family protein [Acidimicrobiia bacterium]